MRNLEFLAQHNQKFSEYEYLNRSGYQPEYPEHYITQQEIEDLEFMHRLETEPVDGYYGNIPVGKIVSEYPYYTLIHKTNCRYHIYYF